jgi:hypothetical protein
MSVFVMALAAGMAVGNGTEPVSGDVMEPVRLTGRWVGTRLQRGARGRIDEDSVGLSKGSLAVSGPGVRCVFCYSCDFAFLDTGDGMATVRLDGKVCEGRFRAWKDHIILCFDPDTGKRPSSLKTDDKTWLLILHSVKPDK